ncbi:hypothetical protein FPOA_26610 [Fusarium poae]|uniref:DUF659 domain-containing protein n=1 Tax=Fusarium poae TaxID=36050 RepID=A0A1B8A9V5_FUSPO|nr:hypothetical protein FPOA_26610 [Fusarium poae]
MSSRPFFKPHGRLEKTTPPRTPSESLGPAQPSTPSSASTQTHVSNDKPSPSRLSDERGAPDASQCPFPIDWDKIRYNRKPVPSIRYRQPHKRAINSKSQPLAIYRHGAQLTTDGNNKFWLCKYCHSSGHHDAALFATIGADPFSIAKRTASLTPYLGSRRAVFNDLKFKDDFTDWVIDLGLTFHPSRSPFTLGSWVKEKWLGDGGRRVWLRTKLQSAKSKVHVSMDAWTSEEGTNYLAVVAHFLDERHKLQTALLDLPPLKGPHSGENIAKVLSTVIDFYDVSPIIGFS